MEPWHFFQGLLTFVRKSDILQLRYCEKCIADNEIWVLK